MTETKKSFEFLEDSDKYCEKQTGSWVAAFFFHLKEKKFFLSSSILNETFLLVKF
jgi:hypothetical protein